MQSQPTVQESGKRRSRRSGDVLQDYLKGLDSEIASLMAEREYLQAKLELVERQRANLQEVIEIEAKLAEMDRRGLGMPETSGEGGPQKGEVAVAPSMPFSDLFSTLFNTRRQWTQGVRTPPVGDGRGRLVAVAPRP